MSENPRAARCRRLRQLLPTMAAASVLLAGCVEIDSLTTPAAEPAATDTSANVDELLTGLEQLPTETNDAPDYDRDDFGDGWADLDWDGCDTRREVLAESHDDPDTFETSSRSGCDTYPVAGTWHDPYTGDTLTFDDLADPDQAQALQIDHVVPVAAAHRGGAWEWTDEQRETFANDPANLLAVDGSTNNDKGDAGVHEWLPPNEEFHCDYATISVTVRIKYDIAVNDAERAALQELLENCR